MSDGYYFLEAVRDEAGAIVDFRIAEVNREAARRAKRTREQLLGRLLSEVASADGWFDVLKTVVETGESIVADRPVSHDGLEVQWAHEQLVPVDDGVAVVSRDVTEDRRIAAERVLQGELAAILHSLGDAVIATDAAGGITFLNAIAEDLTGLTSAAAKGRSVEEVLPPLDGQGDPGRRVIERSSAPMRDAAGDVLGGVVVLRDVTERRKNDRHAALTEHVESLGTMAAGMAHEINNPLANIVANVRYARDALARTELPGEEEVSEILSALSDSADGAERVRRIVADIHALAPDVTPRSVLDLARVVDSALHAADDLAWLGAVRREIGASPLVVGNEGQLARVVTHLLVNAAQVHEEHPSTSPEIRIRTLTLANGWAGVEVCDNGPGIPPELLARIFDPFFTTKTVGSGMGLGLAIARSIAASHGGSLEVGNLPEGGARFVLALPPAKSGRLPTCSSGVRLPVS